MEPFPSIQTCIDYYKNYPSNTIFLDASSKHRFINGPRLPNSRFIDLDRMSSMSHGTLPNMLPTMSYYKTLMNSLEITPQHQLIIYGSEGCVTQSRLYFLFYAFNHPYVSWMQGTFSQWEELNGPLDTEIYKYPLNKEDIEDNYPMGEYVRNVMTLKDIELIVSDTSNSKKNILIDTRPHLVYQSGYIPGFQNFPFLDMVDDTLTTLISKEEILEKLESRGIHIESLLQDNKNIIVSCNSGMTACVMICALVKAGVKMEQVCLYDGSWSEWSMSKK